MSCCDTDNIESLSQQYAELSANTSVAWPVTLYRKSPTDAAYATYEIPTGSTVKAAVLDWERSSVLVGPVTVNESANGSDWANSLIIVELTTTTIANTPRDAWLEVKVGTDQPVFGRVELTNSLVT